MRNYNSKFYLFIFWLLSVGNLLSAQQPKQIEIINANTLEFDDKIGTQAKRLLGDVQFKHDNILMYCDSAYYYENNKIDAFGHVHIKQGDTLNLTGDVLYYDGNSKKAVIKNNIMMQDPTMKLTTEVLNYNLSTGVADYNGNGKIINKKNTLTSKYGYYYSKQKTLYFRQNVKLVTEEYTIYCDTLKHNTSTETSYFQGPTTIVSKENIIYCENGWYNNKTDKAQFNRNAILKSKTQHLSGDSIYYDRVAGYGKAICFVTLIDTSEKIIIKGDLAEVFEKKDFAYVTQNALLLQYDKSDTLYLHSDTLIATYDSAFFKEKQKFEKPIPNPKYTTKKDKKAAKNTKPDESSMFYTAQKQDSVKLDSLREKHRLIKAFHKVKFFRHDMQGSCDSLALTSIDSLMKMYKTPILWSEANQLTADEIKITFNEGTVYRMKMNTNAFIISRNDSLRYNQIKGKTMNGYFLNNSLKKIIVIGNGQANYWITDEKKALIGANHAECSNMVIRLNENQVKKISFLNKPDAKMSPVKNLDPSTMHLEGFKWLGPLRPKTPESVME